MPLQICGKRRAILIIARRQDAPQGECVKLAGIFPGMPIGYIVCGVFLFVRRQVSSGRPPALGPCAFYTKNSVGERFGHGKRACVWNAL